MSGIIVATVLGSMLLVAGGLIVVRLLGGWDEIRIRWKLWRWRTHVQELERVRDALEKDRAVKS